SLFLSGHAQLPHSHSFPTRRSSDLGRGKNEDMITPAQHEQVFRWLNKIKDDVPFDIKTTAAQHYRRVVIQDQMRKNKTDKDAQRSEEHTSELQSRFDLVCRLLLEKK